LCYDDVKAYVGNPFATPITDRHKADAPHQPTLIYLGIDESCITPVIDIPGQEIARNYPGTAYFSLDITVENQTSSYQQEALKIVESAEAKELSFLTVRKEVTLSPEEASVVAMARSFTDWNIRNVVCYFHDSLNNDIVLSSLRSSDLYVF
jgi:hypothetical protein